MSPALPVPLRESTLCSGGDSDVLKWIKTNLAWVQALSWAVSATLSRVCTGLAARKWEGLE